MPALSERGRRYLTAEQVDQLASHARVGRLPVLVLAYCGLRWSELAGLRVRDVDLMRRRLNIERAVTEVNGGRIEWNSPKNNERRSVPLPRFIVKELTKHLAKLAADDLVFTGANGGVLRNRNARRDWFNPAASAIGEPDLTPHELRHTAASLAVSAGANVKAVQRMLGHASAAKTLDRHADLFDDDLDAVAERLDAVYERATRANGEVVKLAAGTR
jgi:integrase